jgi:hypothetical protein
LREKDVEPTHTDAEGNPVYTLCGSQGCCPTATLNKENGNITIEDDDGGTVVLTSEQWVAAKAIPV